jgi:hypothetical protein
MSFYLGASLDTSAKATVPVSYLVHHSPSFSSILDKILLNTNSSILLRDVMSSLDEVSSQVHQPLLSTLHNLEGDDYAHREFLSRCRQIWTDDPDITYPLSSSSLLFVCLAFYPWQIAMGGMCSTPSPWRGESPS